MCGARDRERMLKLIIQDITEACQQWQAFAVSDTYSRDKNTKREEGLEWRRQD